MEPQVGLLDFIGETRPLTAPSSVVLLDMCERMLVSDNDFGLGAIHGYLVARLLLLNSVQVRRCTRASGGSSADQGYRN